MTARKHVAVCARKSTRDPLGPDAETAWPGKLAEPVAVSETSHARGVDLARVQRIHRAPANADVALLSPERPLAALAQPMGAA